ncbi:hypothetical protein BCR36DRAFT_410583 [Piromyces finnis]|uniref:Uncharacterized protein n=1 Tax=Piromyces finnis TaxID=1754191 RepID=A0A1Y1VF84_9FUNG|nr:hypothetical protein BCR36DRAFT_410583 [Piromyces finnis]|eukprot:ORX54776.1 hypothetical protein BCR36DRAFT_410583 [Piromyces finnis]
MTEIKFKSKFIDKYFRKYLNIENEPITENMIHDIKYIYVSTTHAYCIAFGKETLPEIFEFNDCGDEWWACCMKDTDKFKSYKDFLKIENYENNSTLKFINDPDELYCSDKDMKKFYDNTKTFWAEDSDYDELKYDDNGNTGFICSDDLKFFKNAEVVRLMDCEVDIHSIGFINNMPNLKVLEIGRVTLFDHEGIDKLNRLRRLCIW